MMKRTKELNPADDFSTKTLARAAAIVDGYRIILEPLPKGGFVGRAAELPGVMADGKDAVACVNAIRFALETAVATMLENGEEPPKRIDLARRSEQVNIRLTPDEKHQLSEESAQRGFRGLSEFIRSAALDSCKNRRN